MSLFDENRFDLHSGGYVSLSPD